MMCDCDGEDMHNPQPSSCVHLAGPECCEMDEPDDDLPDGPP